MTCAGCRKRSKSPISAHNPAAVSVSIPRRHINRRAVCAHGESGNARAISDSSCSRRIINARDRAAIVLKRPLRRRLREPDAGQPAEMRLRPVGLRAVEADLVAQQQLREPMPRAHQIAAQILPRADQVTQRFRLDARHRDAMQLPRRQQPHQPLGVTPIGLDPITRRPRNQPRRADQTIDTDRLQPAREHEPGRPGLIGRAHRTRQPRRERRHLLAASRQPPHPQLARIAIQHRGHHTAHVHIKGRPGLSLRHVGTPMIAVGAQANSRTLNPRTSCAGADPHITTGRRTDRPYGLAKRAERGSAALADQAVQSLKRCLGDPAGRGPVRRFPGRVSIRRGLSGGAPSTRSETLP